MTDPTPVTARDVMSPEFCGTIDCSDLEARLLATTPEGEGVYIAPDGTLMRVQRWDHIAISSIPVFRLVSIEEASDV